MSKFIYGQFYGFPIKKAAALMLIFILVWAWAKHYIADKKEKNIFWKIGNLLLVLAMLCVIVSVTLTSRGGVSEVILTPFYSLVEMRSSPDLGRSVFMNIFLFFPLGLTLPFALPEKWNRKALLAILFAFLLSFAIEFLQYYYHLGRAETDDVICNTIGCAIGTLAYILERKCNRRSRHGFIVLK